MSEIKWPCDACRNVHICLYASSWRMGGENWFCPVLRKYVDQDSVNVQKEVENHSEEIRDVKVSVGYLDTLREGADAIENRLKCAHDSIREMEDNSVPGMRKKAVACMLYFGMHQNKIAKLLSIPERTFRKLFRGK